MKIVFRADASRWIGSGHVRRCVTLGKELLRRGAEVHLLCRSMPGDQSAYAQEHGLVVHRLAAVDRPRSPERNVVAAHEHWLGVTADEDRRETEEVIQRLRAGSMIDWLVVDHYGLDAHWERAMRPHVNRVMGIDDLADRRHAVDLLLDQNEWADSDSRYGGLVDPDAIQLLGPRYSLVGPEYAEIHPRLPVRATPVRHVLIFFDVTDERNVTGMALEAVRRAGQGRLFVDVVLGQDHPHRDAIRAQAKDAQDARVHEEMLSLAGLMTTADLAIGAGGSTSWERCAVGLPAVVVTMAENQEGMARAFAARGLGWLVGSADQVGTEDLEAVIRQVLAGEDLSEVSRRGRELVDGRGAARVAAALTVSSTTLLRGRQATLADAPLWERCVIPLTSGDASDGSHPKGPSGYGQLPGFEVCQREVTRCRQSLLETAEGVLVAAVRLRDDGGDWTMNCTLEPSFAPSELAKSVVAAGLADLPRLGRFPGSAAPSPAVYVRADWRVSSGRRIAVCSDGGSWLNPYIPHLLADWVVQGHDVCWSHDAALLSEGDVCFYLSYGRIVSRDIRERFRDNLVVHESDLPKGRGWSPLTWQVLDGQEEMAVTLLEAAEAVDAGDIYLQSYMRFEGHELIHEMRESQAAETFLLCRRFIEDPDGVRDSAVPQRGKPTFYPRRRPTDSALDPLRPIAEQFRLLRVVDNERYPAWFELGGHRYRLRIDRYDPS